MADELLVRGAGLVARSEGVGNLAGAKALQNVSDYLAEGTAKVIQKRNKEFNRILSEQMNQPGVSEEELDNVYKNLNKQRFRYVYLNDRRLRGKMEQEIVKQGQQRVDTVLKKDEIADATKKVLTNTSGPGVDALDETTKVNIEKAITNGPIKGPNNEDGYIVVTGDINTDKTKSDTPDSDPVKTNEKETKDAKTQIPYMYEFSSEVDTGILGNYIDNYYKKYLDPNSIFNNLGA